MSSTPLSKTVQRWDALIEQGNLEEAFAMIDKGGYLQDTDLGRISFSTRRRHRVSSWCKWYTRLLMDSFKEFGNWSSWREDVEKNQVTCVGTRTLDNGKIVLPYERRVTLYEGKILAFDMECTDETAFLEEYADYVHRKNGETVRKWDSLLREGNLQEAQEYMVGGDTVESYLQELEDAGCFDVRDPTLARRLPWSDYVAENDYVCSQALLSVRGLSFSVSRKLAIMSGKIFHWRITSDKRWDDKDDKVSCFVADSRQNVETAKAWDRLVKAQDEENLSNAQKFLAKPCRVESNMYDLCGNWGNKYKQLVLRLGEFSWSGEYWSAYTSKSKGVVISYGTRRLDAETSIGVTREMFISNGKCSRLRIRCNDPEKSETYKKHWEIRCVKMVEQLDAALVEGIETNKKQILGHLNTNKDGLFHFHSNFFDLPDLRSYETEDWLETSASIIATSCSWTNYSFIVQGDLHSVTSDGQREVGSESVPIQRTVEFYQGGIVSISIKGPTSILEMVSRMDSMLASGQKRQAAALFHHSVSISIPNMHDITSVSNVQGRGNWRIERYGEKLSKGFVWSDHLANSEHDTVDSNGFLLTPFMTIPVKRKVGIRQGKIEKLHLTCSREDHLSLMCARLRNNCRSQRILCVNFRRNQEVTLVGAAMKECSVAKAVTVLIPDKRVDVSHLSEFVANCGASRVTLHLGHGVESYDGDRDGAEDDDNHQDNNGDNDDMQGYFDQILGSVASQPQVDRLILSEVTHSDDVLAGLLSTTRWIETLVFKCSSSCSFLSLFEAMNHNCSVASLMVAPWDGCEEYWMSEEEGMAVENMLRTNKHLQLLSFQQQIRLEGRETKCLAQGLCANQVLQELHVTTTTELMNHYENVLRENSTLCSLHVDVEYDDLMNDELDDGDWDPDYEEDSIETQVAMLKALDQNYTLTEFVSGSLDRAFVAKVNRICLRNEFMQWIKSNHCNLFDNAALWPNILHQMYKKATGGAKLTFLVMKEHMASKIASGYFQSLSGEKRSRPVLPLEEEGAIQE